MNDKKDIIRVAAVQAMPDLDTRDGTVNRVLQAIAEAADKGAQLIVFPETVIPYYPYFSLVLPPARIAGEHMRLYQNAVSVPGPVTELLAAAARKHRMVVAVGVTERDHASLYNTLAWSLDRLAQLCNMSRSTFMRAFRKVAGVTPGELLARLRMAQAAQWLKQGQRSVGEVGAAVGYESEAAFHRAFKRHMGKGPGQYRAEVSRPGTHAM